MRPVMSVHRGGQTLLRGRYDPARRGSAGLRRNRGTLLCAAAQRRTTGYCHRIICAQDYSAVTAACMMVKNVLLLTKWADSPRSWQVAFNDIDFCMKVRDCRISDRIQSICRTVSLRIQVQGAGGYAREDCPLQQGDCRRWSSTMAGYFSKAETPIIIQI